MKFLVHLALYCICVFAQNEETSLGAKFPYEFRNFSAEGNNESHRTWGMAGVFLNRLGNGDYQKNDSLTPILQKPNARDISRLLLTQTDSSIDIDNNQSAYLWAWGNFIYQDIAALKEASPVERFDIPVSSGDPYFDPYSTEKQVISFNRSDYIYFRDGARQQINRASSYIDCSAIYGTDSSGAKSRQINDGSGRLKCNIFYDSLHCVLQPQYSRGCENLSVTFNALVQLFIKEHNYWCNLIHTIKPDLSGDQIYNQARAIVISEVQAITYNEFLPALLGPAPLPAYSSYNPSVNATLNNEFEVGFAFLNKTLLNNETVIAQADSLKHLEQMAQFEALLSGLNHQRAQEVDPYFVKGLMVNNNNCGRYIDDAAFAIQKGRDQGIPSYNEFRRILGMEPVYSLTMISTDTLLCSKISSVYKTIHVMDLWPLALAENHIIGASVGITMYKVFKKQFAALRDGDRFWYQSYMPQSIVNIGENRTLADIILCHTLISKDDISSNVFYTSKCPLAANK